MPLAACLTAPGILSMWPVPPPVVSPCSPHHLQGATTPQHCSPTVAVAVARAVVLFPIIFYAIFNVYRSQVNPRIKFSDFLFIVAGVAVVANLVGEHADGMHMQAQGMGHGGAMHGAWRHRAWVYSTASSNGTAQHGTAWLPCYGVLPNARAVPKRSSRSEGPVKQTSMPCAQV